MIAKSVGVSDKVRWMADTSQVLSRELRRLAEAQKKAAQTACPALPATAPTVRFSRIPMLNI